MGSPPSSYAIGYASGAFDLFHVGHLRYLRAAAAQCQRLIVGVPTNEIVQANKGPPPVIPHAERMELVGALSCVAQVLAVSTPMRDTGPFADLMESLGVNAVFIGADWAGSPRWLALQPALAAKGIATHFLPRTPALSTTELRARIVARDSQG